MIDENILGHINKSALRFLEPLDPEKTYQTIVEEGIKLVGGEEGYILLENEGELNMVYAVPESLRNVQLRKRGFSYDSYIKRKAFVLQAEDYLEVHPEAQDLGIQSALFIPLFYRNKSMGTMTIMYKKRSERFTAGDLEVLKLFGSMASLAIRKTQLYSETRDALESRDMFLSMAAHEFKTPITTISGYAQMLMLKLKDSDTPERRWVGEIYGETSRLTRLVNELLEVNRIRTGRSQFQWSECNLLELTEKAIKTFFFAHPDHKLEFLVGKDLSDCSIVADQDKLMQVLTNILDNAAKFSPTDKTITISLKSTLSDYLITVRDQGMGIAKKDIAEVFEGFYRGSNNQKEGMGLGLFISREIVESHHGEINVKSKVNHGTTFEIYLPKTKIKKL